MSGLFSKKNKNIDRKRPDFYDGIVTQQEYETILEHAISCAEQIGELVLVANGTITIKNSDNQNGKTEFHLDNLVRRCSKNEVSEWKELIANHFRRFFSDSNKEKYIYKDFDFASQMLKFLVRTYDIVEGKDDFICRVDLPETCTFLILDYDETFHFVRKDRIKEWDKTQEELFEVALENVAAEEVEVKEFLWMEEFEMYTFFSDDFSASFIVDLSHNANFAIGQYGAVVTIPAKGSAFVHPLHENTALNFIASFHEVQQEIMKEDEVPITDKFYWYHQGKFVKFTEQEDIGKVHISLPSDLNKLFKDSSL
ncbi:MAG TPA: hypothetical protein PLC89_00650 [Haliscomenobacter sp.]|uniref:hypothetical protein n=1 Tax=Haliscomenobacter sp. TaxID=2717303 RepID=UPI002C7C3677|nr:hypothetical protein [Haliscomenobacter sp.]HOY15762.1 hypothetical protein [Haliscomenobacter sp.]HPH19394.1 hypothetical protein [Haliscomenobacter sp.]